MKAVVIAISFIAVFALQLFAQVEIPVLEKMAGRWQGSYEMNGENYNETADMRWMLNHNYFLIGTRGEVKEDNSKNLIGKTMEVYTLSSDGKLTGWLFDNKGFAYMVNMTGTFDENSLRLEGTNGNSKCTLTYEFNDKQLTRKYEFTPPGGEEVKSELTYSVVRSDYSTHDMPVTYDKIGEPGLAYVCHLSEDFVSVFNISTNELVGKIPAGRNTDWICFSPDGLNGYITNYSSSTLTVFNRKTNETIATVGAGENPTFLLPVDHKILISHQSRDGIWVLDTYSNTIVKRLPDGTGPLYLIKNENKIYQPQIFTPYLYIIDPVKIEIEKKVKTGGRPMEMAFTGNQKYGYMTNYDFDEITKYDTKSDNVVKRIKNIMHPRGIASSPDGKLVYVSNVVNGKVYVINTDYDSVTAVIDGFTMPVSIAFTADGRYAYVLNQGASTISIIDTKRNEITQSFFVAGNPISIVIDDRQ